MTKGILPWQNDIWRQLTARLAQGGLAHALLLHGPEGVGKNQFARELAKRLLCETAQDAAGACGQCRSCQLLQADSHEDLFLLTPEEDRTTIGVDAVRALIEFMNLTPRRGKYKVALVFPADRMTLNAANSLLKTLEEPSAAAVFILVTSRPAMLPATVRSRCQKLHVTLPDHQTAVAWLTQRMASPEEAEHALRRARGAPLSALAEANEDWRRAEENVFQQWCSVAKDPSLVFDTAQGWTKGDGSQALRWLSGWVSDMARCRVTNDTAGMVDVRRAGALQAMAKQVDLKPLFTYLSTVERAVRDCGGASNSQLLVENVLLEWAALFGRTAQGHSQG